MQSHGSRSPTIGSYATCSFRILEPMCTIGLESVFSNSPRPAVVKAAGILAFFICICYCVWDRKARSSMKSQSPSSLRRGSLHSPVNNQKEEERSEGEVVLLTVQRCDSSKVFSSDNQHDSDAAFPQGGVGLEKVDPKNAHLDLSSRISVSGGKECRSLNIPFHLLITSNQIDRPEDVSSGCKHRWSDENAQFNQTDQIEKNFLYETYVAKSVVGLAKLLNVGCLVTDFCPLRAPRSWVKKVIDELPNNIPFCEVDAHNIVPVWCGSEKREYSARTIRSKLFEQSPKFLTDFPPIIKHTCSSETTVLPPPVNWELILSNYVGDKSVKPVDWAVPGTRAGLEVLYEFIGKRLKKFDPHRNDPAHPALSGLSPWLHFGYCGHFSLLSVFRLSSTVDTLNYGQIAPQRAVLEVVAVQKHFGRSADIFIEECFNRRELA
ncbi:unnamed protein product, partial [Schistosoma curassoni]|uniref:Photolyase/cryptochrome alpha/beta domain-containing protein n=1 Tax=Schistosoma curassoni TaxID=6186 RepID=A0A183KSC3_9TREM